MSAALAELFAEQDDLHPDIVEKLVSGCKLLAELQLPYEICGSWIWVAKRKSTRQHKDVLKAAGFMWASKKKQWYMRGKPSTGRGASMSYIRDKYGSLRISTQENE